MSNDIATSQWQRENLEALATETPPRLIGVIGAGVFGTFHARKYNEHPGAQLHSVFDQDFVAATKLASEFDISAVQGLETFLGADLDAVIITTPAHFHGPVALMALRAGKHVFVEKPIATKRDDAEQMIDIAASKGLILQVGHQERYVADSIGLLNLTEPPKKIISRRCMPPTGRGEDVSVVMDLMIHDLDLVAALAQGAFNNDQRPVISAAWSPGNIGHEIDAELSFQDGALTALCSASRRAKTRERSLHLEFGSGTIHLDFLNRQIINESSLELRQGLEISTETGADKDMQNLAISDPLAYGAHQFIAAINGEKSYGVSGDAGCRALHWGLMIETISDRGTELTNKLAAMSRSGDG